MPETDCTGKVQDLATMLRLRPSSRTVTADAGERLGNLLAGPMRPVACSQGMR